MGRLDGKVALITGAAKGQGRAAALRMAAEGAKLGLTDVDVEGLEETARDVVSAGGHALAVGGDVAIASTHAALIGETVAAYGRIDVLYNNAGIALGRTLDEYGVEDFDRLMHVNCLAQLLAIQRVVPEMRRVGGGSIINVASVGALVALPHLAVYCASKAAVLGLTRGVAYEVAEDGIRCNAICPGGVDTPMARGLLETFDDQEEALRLLTGRQLLKRFADAREIAQLAVFLASDESSFMTGATLPIEAGHSAW